MTFLTQTDTEIAAARFSWAFQFDRREFIRASRLIDRHAIRNPIWRRSSRAILSITGVFLAVMAIGQFSAGYWQNAAIGLIPLLALSALPLLPFVTAYGTARQFEKLYLPTRAVQPSSAGQLRSLVRRRAPNARVCLIDRE